MTKPHGTLKIYARVIIIDNLSSEQTARDGKFLELSRYNIYKKQFQVW